MSGPSAAAVCGRSAGDLLWKSDMTGREAKRYIVRTTGARRGSFWDGQPVQGSGERLNGAFGVRCAGQDRGG
eukprot:scaffold38558_cov64-Phaeocystis_antarctica.AAC.1